MSKPVMLAGYAVGTVLVGVVATFAWAGFVGLLCVLSMAWFGAEGFRFQQLFPLVILMVSLRWIVSGVWIAAMLLRTPRKAVYASDDMLIYISPWLHRVPIVQIETVTLSTERRGFGPRKYIKITGGPRSLFIPIDALDRSASDVMRGIEALKS